MKRFVSVFVALVMMLSCATMSIAVEKTEISVYLDGARLCFDVPPIIIDGRTLVPMRKIFEELGYIVDWNEDRQRVTAVKGDLSIQLDVGDTLAILDNYESAIELDVSAQIIDGRTMVPLRLVGSASKCDVLWDETNNAVHIKSKHQYESEPNTPLEKPALRPNQRVAVTDKYIFCEDYQFALDGSAFMKFDEEKTYSLQTRGDYLYYRNADFNLCKRAISADQTTQTIVIGGSEVQLPISAGEKTTVINSPIENVVVGGKHIYYQKIGDETRNLFQTDLDGNNERILINESCGAYRISEESEAFQSEERIVYKDLRTGALKEFYPASGKTNVIYDGAAKGFDVNHYYVYYVTQDGSVCLHSRYENGDNEIAALNSINADDVWIYGYDIIYRIPNEDDSYSLYRFGRFGLRDCYNVPIIENAMGYTEVHGNYLFYNAMGGIYSEDSPMAKEQQLYMANSDGTGGFPVLALGFVSISYSHIEGNVPDSEHFDEYLQRDLTDYFGKLGGTEYTLLRKSPSQVGVGFPHFYVWMRVTDDEGTVVQEGAARLNAMDKLGFAVTDFITKEQIVEKPDIVERMFPLILQKRVLELAGL